MDIVTRQLKKKIAETLVREEIIALCFREIIYLPVLKEFVHTIAEPISFPLNSLRIEVANQTEGKLTSWNFFFSIFQKTVQN